MRIFLSGLTIPWHRISYSGYNEDMELVDEEDLRPDEDDEDAIYEELEEYYDSFERYQSEVAQVWLMPDGSMVCLSRYRGDIHFDDTEGFKFDEPLLPTDINTFDDLIYCDYHCYDDRYSEYGIISSSAVATDTTVMQSKRLLTLLNEYCAVEGFDGIGERLNDQIGECLHHWSLNALHADYIMQGIKSSAARHFHTIKIATRNHFVPQDQMLWMKLLDTIALCNGNLQDPRNYMPKDFDITYDEWMQRNERRLIKLEKEQERKRIEAAERRYLENKEVIEQEDREYYRDKRPFLAVRFDTETMEFHVLQDVREFFEEGLAQNHCVFNNKYYKMPDYIVMSCTDKKTGKRLSTVTIDVEKQSIVANLCKGNHVPRNEREIADTIVEHMPMFVQANTERKAERCADYSVDAADIARQESERRINAHFAGDRQREREQIANELNAVAV